MSTRIAHLACLLILTAALSVQALAQAQRAAARTPAAAAPHGQTQLLKCRDALGRITYSDRGCDGATDSRELRVDRYSASGLPPRPDATRAPVARKRDATRAASAGRDAATGAGGSSGGAGGQVAGLASAAGDERDALRARRDEYRRDVNRARTKASQLSSLPGYR